MAQETGKAGKSRFPRRFSLVFTFLFLVLYWPGILLIPRDGVFKHFEDIWMDRVFRMREDSLPSGDPRIIIAALDVDTLKKYGIPVPRSVHAQLLDKFRQYGVKTVVFDVMFFEPRERASDLELVAATRRFKRVVHLFQYDTKDTPYGPVMTTNMPIPGIKEASQHLGYPNIQDVIDSDGHIRRSKLFDERVPDPKNPDLIAPSMDVVALASYLDEPLADLRLRYADPRPREFVLNFRRSHDWLIHQKRDEALVGKVSNLATVNSPYQHISALDLLSGELTAAQRKALKGSLVLIGSTAIGYYDHYPTPFTTAAPGVEYHANNVDNLLHDDFLKPVKRLVILPVLLAMIWLPMLLLRVSPAAGNAVVGGLLLFWGFLSYWCFGRGIRLDFVSPVAALVISFLVQTVHRVLTEGAEKKFIKNLFGQFVAPEVVDDLAKDPGKVKLGGEKRDMTVFFLDIAHFTTISEKMAPEALILFLNKYLSALSHIVHEQKGVVDKYIGDCIMAFWNAPLPLPDHRTRACLAAVECQEMMKELNKDLDPGLPEIPMIRIGLNAGDMTVGLTGSEKKLQYTVIGDEVNLASRLEGANKFFGSHIMASESVFNGAREAVEARELGRVRVVGKAVPIRVFELLAKKGGLSEEWKKALPHYEKGVAQFNNREWAQALLSFQEVIKIFPDDGPARLYLNAAKDYSAVEPPKNWDGVFNLTAK